MASLLPPMLTATLAAAGTLNAALNLYPPFATWRARASYNLTPNQLPDLSALATMAWRKDLSDEDYLAYARQVGFDKPLATAFRKSLRYVLSVREYVSLLRRGEIEQQEFVDGLRANGVADNDIQLVLKSTEYFPPPDDLIRFAVRDVYSSQTRKAFGMDEDLPPEFIRESARAGLPKEQAENYWASHWNLPSALQGFEMYQRGVIKQEQLYMLLKSLDIMPFWRNALLQISYNPIPRVDVRRMHAMGLINDSELQDRYQAAGYSPDDSKLMVRFTRAYNTKEEAGASQSSILEAFRKGVITETEARYLLGKLSIDEEAINLQIRTAQFDLLMSATDDLKADLFQQYISGALTEGEVRQRLTATGAPDTYVQTSLAELNRRAAAKIKIPSKDDLLDWITKGLIDEATFMTRMRELGYRESDVILYLSERTLDNEERERRWLSNSIYLRWFKKGMIDRERLELILREKGTQEADIQLLISEISGA